MMITLRKCNYCMTVISDEECRLIHCLDTRLGEVYIHVSPLFDAIDICPKCKIEFIRRFAAEEREE